LWQPREADLPARPLAAVMRWWAGLPRSDSLPSIKAIDPQALGPAADHLLIVEPIEAGQDFVYRYYGAGVARADGHDMTGQRASALGDHAGLFVMATYRAVLMRRQPLYTEHEPPQNLFVTQYDRLILPLADADGKANRLVVGNVPEAPMRTLVDTVMDGVLVLDRAGRIRMANPAALAMLGTGEAELLGHPVAELLLAEFIAAGPGAGEGLVTQAREAAARRDDGREFPVEVSIGETRRGRDSVFIAVLRDISARKAAEERYRALAFTDPLTGLANRLLFEERMAQAIARARRTRSQLALFMIDLDDFKTINDRFGHPAGDKLLTGFAQRVQGVVREIDVLARFGGDEFALVQTDLLDAEGARTLAGRLFQALAEPFQLDGRAVPLTVSLGIALHPQDGESMQALIEHADQALYVAKSRGGACHVFYRELAA
jgi:diguanylate cyclase (GGDEF)-like protein/PAS domain S-box-containing protein